MSLPSSVADFVPCDRLLQKAYLDWKIIRKRSMYGRCVLCPHAALPAEPFLRTVPTITIAHTFCASRDIRVSHR